MEVPLKSYFIKSFDLTKSLKEVIKKDYLVEAVENSKVSVAVVSISKFNNRNV